MECIEAVNEDRKQWNILGFVDDNVSLAGTSIFDHPVLGPAAILAQPVYQRCRIAIGVANDRDIFVRQKIRKSLDAMTEERLPAIIHPSAVVSKRSQIGAGSVLFAGSFLSGNCAIGMHALVLQGAIISHDTKLGNWVTVCAGVTTGGGVKIGDGAFVGLGARIYPNVRIGQGSRVGLGSVVLHDVGDNETVSGSPARKHEHRIKLETGT
jgi:sugar O-acyltransferase (sialic acid O-acetyltransferase NeuD family)